MPGRNINFAIVVFLALLRASAFGDEVLYSYEGDVLPQDAGWLVYDECDPGWCQESIEDGHFVLQWEELGGGAFVNYKKPIALLNHGPPAPPSLWVEYRYRSNRPLGPIFDGCDGEFYTTYVTIAQILSMYGDTVFTYAGDGITNLPLDEFYTVRFESPDGMNFRLSANGRLFAQGFDDDSPGNTYLQLIGHGGCNDEFVMAVRNEWDFVRYGTISHDERIIAVDPPIGFLNPVEHAARDRFTVTYDSPNYAYIDDIAVEVSGGDTPIVIATKRLDNGPPDVLQVILDRPLPAGERTTFTFNDGATTNVVSYTFQLGDSDADGDWDLRDLAGLQDCFGDNEGNAYPCPAFNFVQIGDRVVIDGLDFAEFSADFTGPIP